MPGSGLFSNDVESEKCTECTMEGTLYNIKNTFELTKGINLGSIINHSWDLLAWSDSNADFGKADISLHPGTSVFSNFAFDDFDKLVDIGREAAEAKIETIKAAYNRVIEKDTYI